MAESDADPDGNGDGLIARFIHRWAFPVLVPIFAAIAAVRWTLSIDTSRLIVEVKNNTTAIGSLKTDMRDRMSDRFTGTEGAKLDARILYLERRAVNHSSPAAPTP